jgi:3-dehydroquinate synthase
VKRDKLIKIDDLTYPVYLGSNPWDQIRGFIQPWLNTGNVYILTDYNTNKHCFPVLIRHLPSLEKQALYSIEPGEKSKSLAGLERVWNWLTEAGTGRDSLIINLGGGVVSDVGGFAAATFKRGIAFINIPTSLIGQVDAAIGGKTGINVAGIKNQAGVFYNPSAVFIIPEFLRTLPEDHFRSGAGEIIKCAALSGTLSREKLNNLSITEMDHLHDVIYNTVKFKCGIVARDPSDQSLRKILNFGHTVGHALEAFYNRQELTGLLHGEAVAAGIVCEAAISSEIAGLSPEERDEISSIIKTNFILEPLRVNDFVEILELMGHDKKRAGKQLNFSLLESFGKPLINCAVGKESILRSLKYLNQILQK